MTVLPYQDQKAGKKEQVATMFNNISERYDFLNHLLRYGIDIYWRKQALKFLKKHQPKQLLDIATGTGDFAIAANKHLNPDKITGVDISAGMLEMGKQKIKKLKLQDKIELKLGDSEKLPFEDNTFDAVIVSFGVRNFEDLEKGLRDMNRVLKKDGALVILEFSKPTNFLFKQIYFTYFKYILPVVGKLISKDQAAYTYLPESVSAFPAGEEFLNILKRNGYINTQCKPLTFGISSVYYGVKS